MKRFVNIKENIKKCEAEFVVVSAVLFLTIVVGVLALVFVPKQTFSEDENRALEPAPKITLATVEDGRFMKSIESYVGDHFMLRKSFVSLNTSVQLLVGKRDLGADYSKSPAEGGVYFGKADHIYEVLLPSRNDTFASNVSALNLFAKKTTLPFYFVPVPSGSQEQHDKLPLFAPNHDQHEELNAIKASAGQNSKVIDLFATLSDQTGNDYYYKTDHHWNTYGAYVGYKALADAMGVTAAPQEDFDFKVASSQFYGTLYSKAVLASQVPDTLYLPIYKKKMALTQQTGKQTRSGIFWQEYLQKKDKYSVFLGGNHSVDVIKNTAVTNGKKLLILKDSYANSMVPFLVTNFSEIHIIDLRYYNQDIYDYIQQNGITETAAIYSIKQLCDISVANKLSAR